MEVAFGRASRQVLPARAQGSCWNSLENVDFDFKDARNKYVVHVPFKMRIIKYALDNFPTEDHNRGDARNRPRDYPDGVYESLGLSEFV